MSGKIKVEGELSLDGSGWSNAIDKAEHEVEHLANEGVAELKNAFAGAFALGAVESAVHGMLNFGAEISHTATRLGVSTDAVQEFNYAAGQTRTELDQVSSGLDHLTKNLQEMKDGTQAGQKVAQALERLGISAESVKDAAPEEVLRRIGEALEHTAMTGERSAAMMELFGTKAGSKLIPFLKELSELSAKARSEGLIISEKDIEQLHEAEKGLENIETKLKIIGVKAASGEFGAASLGKKAADFLTLGSHVGGDLTPEQKAKAKAAADAEEAELAARRNGEERKESTLSPDDQKAQDKEQMRLREDTVKREEKLREDRLTTEQKITEAKQKQLELEQAIDRLVKGGHGDEFNADQLRNQHAVGAENLNKLQSEALRERAKDTGPRTKFESDRLTSVGNFLGDSGSAVARVGHKTNEHLAGIHGTLKTIAGKLGDTAFP